MRLRRLLVSDVLCRITHRSISVIAPDSPILAPNRTGFIRQRLENWLDGYEDFIGIKAVKQAQLEVIKWEERLSEAQLLRREKQAEIKNLQSKLKEIHFDLDRTSRGEDKYLELLTAEHATIKQERHLLETFEGFENSEREAFHQLSTKVRESHERERERSEKTKWWGVTASLIGAALGIMGSSISNEIRLRRMREMIPLGSAGIGEMAALLKEQNYVIHSFVDEMKGALDVKEEGIAANGNRVERQLASGDVDKVLSAVKAENASLSEQMKQLVGLVKLQKSLDNPEAVVYVGDDMERLLHQTEKNIESRMKLQTLLSVVLVYSALGLAIPVVYSLFK